MRASLRHIVLVLLLGSTVSPAQIPVITAVAPLKAHAGTLVTVTGNGFDPTSSDNIVYCGGVRATVHSSTTTMLQFAAPVGATYAPLTVTVAGRTATSPLPFSVTFPSNQVFGSGSFSGRMEYSSVSAGPYRVALGDIDGDGLSDIVIANYQGSSCAVRRNQTTGDSLAATSFSAEADLATGFLPVSLVLADIDGDGLLDIIIGHQFSPFVSIYRNRSTVGVIDLDSRFDVPASAGFLSVAVADIDRDGRMDIAIANRDNNSIAVHRNTGGPGILQFGAAEIVASGTGPVSILTNDWDRDGIPDLAFVDGGGSTASFLRNLSTPGALLFGPKQIVPVAPSPSAIVAGDITGDGMLDAVAVSGTPGVLSILPGTSSAGSIGFGSRVDVATLPDPRALALGDVDGDGRVDVGVVSSSSANATIHRNIMDGGSAVVDAGTSFPIPTASLSVVLGDLTSNAKPELVAANVAAASVSVYRNAVLPPPRIDIYPGVLLFPDVAVGDSVAQLLTVRNLSPAPLTLTAVVSSVAAFHPVMFLPAIIPGNDSLIIPVRFRPGSFGQYVDTLRLSSNGGDTSAIMIGSSPSPVLQGLPDSLDFGSVPNFSSAMRTYQATNGSVNALRIDSVLTRHPFSLSFTETVIGKADTALAVFGFGPLSLGPVSDSITIVTNGLPLRKMIHVRGVGLDVTLLPVGVPWSLVSLPRVPLTHDADSLFPGKTGLMFMYVNITQNYDFSTTLANGPGYWVKYDVLDTLALSGTALDSIEVPAAREGWVLFGSITRQTMAAAITTVPAGTIISPVFQFNIDSQLYEPAAVVRPGEGYWVKVDRPCRIIIH